MGDERESRRMHPSQRMAVPTPTEEHWLGTPDIGAVCARCQEPIAVTHRLVVTAAYDPSWVMLRGTFGYCVTCQYRWFDRDGA